MKKCMILILLLFIPISVSARSLVDCDVTVLSSMKSLAANINISSNYRIDNNQAYFDVTINNITPDIYFIDNSTNITYNYSNTNNGEITITGYTNIEKINYTFYSSDKECSGNMLTTKYVTFPNYNQYYGDEICKGIENYSLCKRWAKVTSNYDEFKTKVENYKNNKPVIVEPEKPSVVEGVLNFLIKYIIAIIIGTIIIIGLISFKRHKDRFDFKV